MTIRREGHAFIADTARVRGEVTLGEDVSLWYGAAVRGDVAAIAIGPGTNIQDNAVVHCDSGVPNHIGSLVTVGHGAIVHGKRVGDGTLIGMHATVLGQSVIGSGCLIAAGALVPPGMVVPDGMVVIGVPGRIARPTTDEEKKYLAWLAPHYIQLARLHADNPQHERTRPWSELSPADARVIELETRFAFAEHTLEELNRVIIEQHRRIETLEKDLERAKHQIKRPQYMARPEDESPPPHY